jgi:hypothetical protein
MLASVISLRLDVQGHKWRMIGVYIYISNNNISRSYTFRYTSGSPAVRLEYAHTARSPLHSRNDPEAGLRAVQASKNWLLGAETCPQ